MLFLMTPFAHYKPRGPSTVICLDLMFTLTTIELATLLSNKVQCVEGRSRSVSGVVTCR